MAIVPGAWSQRARFGWDMVQSPASVSSGTGTVSLTAKLYFSQSYTSGGYDQTNTVTISGAVSASFSHNFNYSDDAWHLIWSTTITVPTSYAASSIATFNASNGAAFFDDADPSASRVWTIAKRPAQVPSPPSSVSAVQVGDDTTVSWVRPSNYAADANKWANAVVQWQIDAGAWTTFRTVSPSATSVVLGGQGPNSRRRYRVAGSNSSGTSSFTQSGYIYTTPATPTGVSVVKAGADLVVSFSSTATYATSFEVEDDGAGTVASGPSSPVTVTSPNPAATHRYRVRAVAPGGVVSPWSAWSSTIQLQAPPLAPTNLSPDGGSLDSAGSVVLSWKHAPVDASAQTAREVQYRIVGAGSWTVSTASTSSQSLNLGTLAEGSYEWQVKTKGAHASYGPLSALATFTVAAAPTATLTSPDVAVAGSSTTVAWMYAQAASQPQSAWEAEIVDGATVLATSGVVSSAAGSWTSPQILEDAASYTARVRVRSSAGVWSVWATQAFTVTYAPPAVPLLDVEWIAGAGAVQVHAAAQSGGGEVMRNLIINPEAEVDATGWGYGFGATTITRDTAQKKSGLASIKGTCVTADTLEIQATPATQVGEVYTLSGQLRGSKAMTLNFGEYFGTTVPVALTTAFAPFSVTFVCANSGQRVGLSGAVGAVPGDAVWIDEGILTKGDEVVAFFSGSTADAGGLDFQWVGTAHASQSIAVDPTDAAIQDTISLTLERSIDGSEWELVGTDANDIDVIEFEVPLSGSLRYRALATSALPSTAEQVVTLVSPHELGDHGHCGVWLNGGPGFAVGALLSSNLDINEDIGIERGLHQYDGRPLPVPIDTILAGRSFSVSAQIMPFDDADGIKDALRTLALTKGVFLYRDPDGTFLYCQVSNVRMSRARKGDVTDVSFSVVETDRATPTQLLSQQAYQVQRLIEIRPGEVILAGGPGLLSAEPGEYIMVDE